MDLTKYSRQDMPLTNKKQGVLFLPDQMNAKDWELFDAYIALVKEAYIDSEPPHETITPFVVSFGAQSDGGE